MVRWISLSVPERLAQTRLALIADVKQDEAKLLCAKHSFVLLLPAFSLPHCAEHVPLWKVSIRSRVDHFSLQALANLCWMSVCCLCGWGIKKTHTIFLWDGLNGCYFQFIKSRNNVKISCLAGNSFRIFHTLQFSLLFLNCKTLIKPLF